MPSDKPPRRVVGSQAFQGLPELNKIKAYIVERLRMRVDVIELAHPAGRVLVFEVPARPVGQPLEFEGAYLMRAGEDLVAAQAWIAAWLVPSQQLWPLAIFCTMVEDGGSLRLTSWSAAAQARFTSSSRAKRGFWVVPWQPAHRATPPFRTLVQSAVMKFWMSTVCGAGPE